MHLFVSLDLLPGARFARSELVRLGAKRYNLAIFEFPFPLLFPSSSSPPLPLFPPPSSFPLFPSLFSVARVLTGGSTPVLQGGFRVCKALKWRLSPYSMVALVGRGLQRCANCFFAFCFGGDYRDVKCGYLRLSLGGVG